MLSPRQLEQRSNAGKVTLNRHGRDHYVKMGKKGGRPTFEEANERAAALATAERRRNRPGRPRTRKEIAAPA